MKKLKLLLLPLMLAAGCARNIETVAPFAEADASETKSEILTRSIGGAIYNEIVDAWMIPQKDPYTLENFQKAYDNLATKKSSQTLSKSQATEFVAGKKLKPTHYALKIYPHTEEEQWRVEMMEDVQVTYIPFHYTQLTQKEVAKLHLSKTKSVAANSVIEKSPYTVTCEDYYTTDGGPTGPVTYQLPILYTVWPITKPIPDDLEYVVDYEIFLPYAVTDKHGKAPTHREVPTENILRYL